MTLQVTERRWARTLQTHVFATRLSLNVAKENLGKEYETQNQIHEIQISCHIIQT